MLSSIQIFTELRQLFHFETLTKVKKAASYCKNCSVPLDNFVRSCLDTGHFPEFQVQTDLELENFLRAQRNTLKELLPNADPAFLEDTFNTHAGTAGIDAAVMDAILYGYPKNTVQKEEAMFDVKLYCELVPDPLGSFSHKNYIMTDRMATEAVDYLQKIFGVDKRAEITAVVKEEQGLYLSYKKMRVGNKASAQFFTDVKTKQPKTFDMSPDYGQVFEKLFIENEGVILSFIKNRDGEKKIHKCNICFGFSTKLTKICSDGHKMCGQCIKNHTELLYHEGVLYYSCAFEGCKLLISNAVIRSVWDTSRYSKLLVDRIANSKADSRLVTCPFCCFQNRKSDSPELHCTHCSKTFCVTCKKRSHLPLECNKRENDLCKLVEENMTLALIRKCPKCRIPFIKERECCNKMMCYKCKIYMCYVCRKVLKDNTYSHFYGQGVLPSEAPGLCPLFSDINTLHVNSVIQSGKQEFQKIKSENPDVKLLYDPLAVLPKKEKSDAVPNQF